MPGTTEKTEEKKGLADASFSEENMYNVDTFEKETEEEDAAIEDFIDYSQPPAVEKTEEIEKPEVKVDADGKKIEETEDDDFKFEDSEKATEEQKIDLEIFNKKFNKDFKSQKELDDFMNVKQEKEESNEDEKLLETATNQIELLEPTLALNNEDLMRRQFETIAIQDKKDINNEDVKIEIEEQIQDLNDKGVLNIQADHLRGQIKNIYDKSVNDKSSIETKRTEKALEDKKVDNKKLQDEFVKLHGVEDFFGVEVDKKTVGDAYKKVTSGEFIKSLQADKAAMAELALIAEIRDKIYSKATGKTYSDGIKAVLEDYKSKGKDDVVAKAQKRGSVSSGEGSNKLVNGLLYEAPTKEE